ncbi:1,4-dihydroxy-6-naphthoate synthase [Arcticibacter eurypsychrophilus]|uniref:1,4-dihydroxy-6-naphthoate synthase n=1 Tax=Arcticibacter eurypsychrophilus TaxID=1434752 RepID=UPI00084D4B9A|nr:1,4-dihydroxy-6-naphthoate synthase [Arcticibacter eurypsychrophilus]
MKLKLGFSPCPNDTFIFDALIHHKIDTEGLDFEVFYDDVETLNHKAFRQDLDVTKLSFHAYAYCVQNYVLLDSGSALGYGVGPLVISKYPVTDSGTVYTDKTVAIPGKFTTANFLFSLAFPEVKNKVELVFSEIEEAVLSGKVDLGLIIHENRFTYEQKGLHKVIDLGAYWEEKTGCAIPLGGIVAKRSLDQDTKHKINRVLRKSVEYAFTNPTSGIAFIRSHAQTMEDEVMYKHIGLYVNKYSVDLGSEGRSAIELLFSKAVSAGVIPEVKEHLFLI